MPCFEGMRGGVALIWTCAVTCAQSRPYAVIRGLGGSLSALSEEGVNGQCVHPIHQCVHPSMIPKGYPTPQPPPPQHRPACGPGWTTAPHASAPGGRSALEAQGEGSLARHPSAPPVIKFFVISVTAHAFFKTTAEFHHVSTVWGFRQRALHCPKDSDDARNLRGGIQSNVSFFTAANGSV